MTHYLLRRLGALFAAVAAASLLLAFSAGPAAASGNRGHDHGDSSCACQKHDGSRHGNDDRGDRNKNCRDGKDWDSHDNRWTPENKCHDNGKHKGYYKHHRHHHHDDGCRRH